MLEPACLWCLPGIPALVRYHVPFAGHGARVSALRETFRDRRIAAAIGPDGILSGQQRLTARIAFGLAVIACKTQSAPGQPVDVGRVDFSPVAAEVRIPQIIGQDDDNIGFRWTVRFRAIGSVQGRQRREQHGGDEDECGCVRHGRLLPRAMSDLSAAKSCSALSGSCAKRFVASPGSVRRL